MKIAGIICEYNPFHAGHKKQMDTVRSALGSDCGIVCLMSGNFVQRGSPAIVDKSLRAKAALLCGADLVLELPVTYALRSAEGFARGGVSVLSGFCSHLSFGTETANTQLLMDTAQALLSPDFSEVLRSELELGLSFPAARQAALEQMGIGSTVVQHPNDILAVEYCKAILSLQSNMTPLPVLRSGSYHATEADKENPSATSLRLLMEGGKQWLPYVPEEAAQCLRDAQLHSIHAGERAILGKLRCMTDAEFEALPYGSEGLWRKLMHASRSEAALEDILAATKSKRYTRTRLDRMVLCAFLGISKEILSAPAPYIRVLALNSRGREILKKARSFGCFPNIGQAMDHPYQRLENRCGDLYGLFALDAPEGPGKEAKQRILCL